MPTARAGCLRVLVADDNRYAADSVALLLRLAGHEVAVAYDGSEALDWVQGERPDVVLLDIGMPGLDGWELARRVRQLPWERRPLLVAVTGYGTDEDRRRSQAAGIDAHLTKPVDPDLILRLLAGFARVLRPPG